MISSDMRHALLHDAISQPNKLHLIAGLRERGHFVEHRFSGEFLRTRMSVQLEPEGPWHEVKSYEFDVRPHLEWNRK